MLDLTHLIKIIANVLSIPENEIQKESCFIDMKNWDSLSSLHVMTAIEQEYGIRIPIYKFLKANSISDLLQLLQ